jgi:hypothetical protein
MIKGASAIGAECRQAVFWQCTHTQQASWRS